MIIQYIAQSVNKIYVLFYEERRAQLLLKNITDICKSKNISIAKMERDLGFARGYIAKWGEIEPGYIKVKRVADYLNVKVDKLLC